MSRLTSHSAGYVLWSAVVAALPFPLTGGVEYAVPFPFAGSTKDEEKELRTVDYAATLYTPTALRRRRKHTVTAQPTQQHAHTGHTHCRSSSTHTATHVALFEYQQLVLDLDEVSHSISSLNLTSSLPICNPCCVTLPKPHSFSCPSSHPLLI